MRNRKPNRLKEYNYLQNGMYFVTVCIKDRVNWFGEIKNTQTVLNEYGKIVELCWNDLPNHYGNVLLDTFVVMPNHFHGVIIIDNMGNGCANDNVGNGFKPFPTHGLSEIIRGFKTFSSRRINEQMPERGKFQWQKSFYDHIIRDELSLSRIREYITNNSLQWDSDVENAQVCKQKFYLDPIAEEG